VRRGVESEVVTQAAQRATEPDLIMLDTIITQMRRGLQTGGTNFPTEDRAFHRLVVIASGNQVALSLVDLFWDVMDAVYRSGFPGPSAFDAPAVVEAHAEIVAALRRRDGSAAQGALRRHLEEAERRFTTWQQIHDIGSDERVTRSVQAALLGLAHGATAMPSTSAVPATGDGER
jgi:DNA-binding FadR family transcriptional regulator